MPRCITDEFTGSRAADCLIGLQSRFLGTGLSATPKKHLLGFRLPKLRIPADFEQRLADQFLGIRLSLSCESDTVGAGGTISKVIS
jgi:hypothetical protein